MSVPLKQAYAPNVVLVLLTLFPQLINTAAYPLLAQPIARDFDVAVADVARYSLYNEAAFIFGILAGTTMMRHLNLRPVYLAMLALDIVIFAAIAMAGSNLEAIALNVLAGLIGGIFLMVALPPLFTNFEAKYFPISAALMVPCLFGAATAAPLVTAPLTGAMLWRPLLWGETAALGVALVLALLTVGSKEPQQRDVPVDWFALIAGGIALALVFGGVKNAASHEWPYPAALAPFLAGVVAFAVLIVTEYRKSNPLLPLSKLMLGFALIGFLGAAFGNAIYIADNEVFTVASRRIMHLDAMQMAAAAWPLFLMTIAGGAAFGRIVRTKYVPLFTLAGLVALAAGSALLLLTLAHSNPPAQRAATFLIGYGAATTITPGLFTVGLSLPRDFIIRGIASIETVRLTIGFIAGPLTQHAIVAHVASNGLVQTLPPAALLAGMHAAMLYVVAFSVAGVLLASAVIAVYYRRPHAPDIERYIEEGKPAFASPPLDRPMAA